MRQEDESLVTRIRSLMKHRRGCTEQKMFGSVCFMINGNLCVGPCKSSLIVRLDREQHDKTQSEPYVMPMDITGKVMRGWARIEPAGIETDDDLKAWIDRAVKFVRTLPAKA